MTAIGSISIFASASVRDGRVPGNLPLFIRQKSIWGAASKLQEIYRHCLLRRSFYLRCFVIAVRKEHAWSQPNRRKTTHASGRDVAKEQRPAAGGEQGIAAQNLRVCVLCTVQGWSSHHLLFLLLAHRGWAASPRKLGKAAAAGAGSVPT